MREGIRAAALAAVLLCAAPAGARASTGLRGADAPVARGPDRFAPPPGALPRAGNGARMRLAPPARIAALGPAERQRLDNALAQARAARDTLPDGTPRAELAAAAHAAGRDARPRLVARHV